MVNVDELPEAMIAGSAMMLTDGIGIGVTKTVAAFDVLPPAPDAVAV